MALWGGRFEGAPASAFTAINDSLPVDARLVREDVEGSIAWAGGLETAGVLTADEAARIRDALLAIAEQAEADPAGVRDAGDEDVHAWVEARLVERLGDPGKKLHTGRSRNDQVATDLRLWTRRQIARRRAEIRAVQASLVRLGERERETVLPGYTHLQRAQPVLFAHWCLAYFEMLERDLGRLADASGRAGECPLGAGALAGTAYPIDRAALARDLGFGGPTANSLDAVSDRDFVIETIHAAMLCGLHLGRLAEDLVFYASGEAGFVTMDDSVASGSSLMPQKKNPDALELIRGKCGRLIGALTTVATMMKGLPLAYDKDMQEDKEPLFDAMDTLGLCLRVLPAVLDGLVVHRNAARAAAVGGCANATELADYLVSRGVPFRAAHEQAGRIVRHAMETGTALESLPVATMARFAPQVDAGVLEHLTLEATLAKRDVHGGTAPARVQAALARAAAMLAEEDAATGSQAAPKSAVRRRPTVQP
jgi:argininosuccinate lyase